MSRLTDLLRRVDPEDVMTFLALIEMLLGRGRVVPTPPIPTPIPPPTPTPVPIPTPPPVIPPAPVATGQVYYRLEARPYFQERNNQVVSETVLMVNDRLHIDISPFDSNDKEIRTGDPRHVKVPNDVPVRYRWWRDGKLNTQGEYSGMRADEHDHFNLESVRDRDNGFTPVLRLVEAEPGQHQLEFEAFIPAEYNGGVEITSNKFTYQVD